MICNFPPLLWIPWFCRLVGMVVQFDDSDYDDKQTVDERELLRIDNIKTILIHILSSIDPSSAAEQSNHDSLLENLTDLLLLLKEDAKQQETVMFTTFCQFNATKRCLLPLFSLPKLQIRTKIVEIFYILTTFVHPLHKSNIADPLSVAQHLQQLKKELASETILKEFIFLIKDFSLAHLNKDSVISQPLHRISMILSLLTNILLVNDSYQFNGGSVVEKGLHNLFISSLHASHYFDFLTSLFNSIEEFNLESCIPYALVFIDAIFCARDFKIQNQSELTNNFNTNEPHQISKRNSKFIGTFNLVNEPLNRSAISYSSLNDNEFDESKKEKILRKRKSYSPAKYHFDPFNRRTSKILTQFCIDFVKDSLRDLILCSFDILDSPSVSVQLCQFIINLIETIIDKRALIEIGISCCYALLQKNFINKTIDVIFTSMNEKKFVILFAFLKLLNSLLKLIVHLSEISGKEEEQAMIKYYSYFFHDNVEFKRLLRDLSKLKLDKGNKVLIVDSIYNLILLSCLHASEDLKLVYESGNLVFPTSVLNFSSSFFCSVDFVFELLEIICSEQSNSYEKSVFDLLQYFYQLKSNWRCFFKISCIKMIFQKLNSKQFLSGSLQEFLSVILRDFVDYLSTTCFSGLDIFFELKVPSTEEPLKIDRLSEEDLQEQSQDNFQMNEQSPDDSLSKNEPSINVEAPDYFGNENESLSIAKDNQMLGNNIILSESE